MKRKNKPLMIISTTTKLDLVIKTTKVIAKFVI